VLRRQRIAESLHFAGDFHPHPKTAGLLPLVRELGLVPYVRFHECYVSEQTYRNYLVGADLAVQLLRRRLGILSGALLDCSAAGLPAVTNKSLAASVGAPHYIQLQLEICMTPSTRRTPEMWRQHADPQSDRILCCRDHARGNDDADSDRIHPRIYPSTIISGSSGIRRRLSRRDHRRQTCARPAISPSRRQSSKEPAMAETKAVVVDPASTERLAIKSVLLAPAYRDEVTVRVRAISLNRGEVNRAVRSAEAGWRPGWDFAGTIEELAPDGGGPAKGTRVVGILPSGAWAETIRVAKDSVAGLPDDVTDAQAATLPVAGLTALHALRQGGLLLGRKVLIDGASGGVGHLACQLAAASGAIVHGHVRNKAYRDMVAEWCGERTIVAPDLSAAAAFGPFHLILDSVGGSALGAALRMLRPDGTCVTFGVSEAPSATFDSAAFFRSGGSRLYGLVLFPELRKAEPASEGLAILAAMVARGTLKPRIEIEADWTEIGAVARQLLDRGFMGKAVLHLR
jgi:NADPH2:quinone reductase